MNNAHAARLTPESSLLLIIDFQEKFAPHLWKAKRVEQSALLLINVAKQFKLPIVVTEHNPERIGKTVPALVDCLPKNSKYFRKDIFSCFGDETVKAEITAYKDIKTIIIAGCETHICVMQTALDALKHGYNVHVVANAVSSRKEIDWHYGLERISQCGAVLATSEMVSYEFLGRSDIPEFKALLPAFKEWVNRNED
jgi:nicotinamidase-related amidase